MSPTEPLEGQPGVFRQAACFAIVFGLIEGVLYQVGPVLHYLIRQTVRVGANGPWMASVTNLVVFLAAGAGLVVLRRLLPRLTPPAIITGALLALGVFSLLLLYRQLFWGAAALLAAGIGWRLAGVLTARPAGFRRLVHRSLPALGAVLAGVILWSTVGAAMRERRTLAALPEPADGRPNVLFIILDTVRDFSTSLGGYERKTTPTLERLAASGTAFDAAISTAPWTMPSHASMFTGQYPDTLGLDFSTGLGPDWPTVAEAFRDRGYATAGFVANNYVSRLFGLERGFVHYSDFPVDASQLLLHSSLGRALAPKLVVPVLRRLGDERKFGRKPASFVTRNFLAWSRTTHGRPFYAFLNFMEAHHPYQPPAPYERMFTPPGQPRYRGQALKVNRLAEMPEELEASRNAYDGSIAYLDHQVDLILTDLEQRGLLDNTLVAITADHGEHLGAHGIMYHGKSVYRQEVQVPLVLRYPARVPAGERIEDPVTLRDLGATLIDLAGLEGPTGIPGRSWRAEWDSSVHGTPSPVRAELLVGEEWHETLFGPEYQIVRHWDAPPELFSIDDDPRDLHSLAGTPGGAAERLAALADSLDGYHIADRADATDEGELE